MKKLFILLAISGLILLGLTLWLFLKTENPTSIDYFLQERFPHVLEKLSETNSIELTNIASESKPSELNNVHLSLPHYQDYDLSELKNLFNYTQSCARSLNIKKPSSELDKAWQWARFTCQQGVLSKDFFKKSPYLFPSGKSFIQLAEEAKFQFDSFLSTNEILNYRSLEEEITRTSIGSDLNLQQIQALYYGEDILVGENFVYLRKKINREAQRQKVYLLIDKKNWTQAFNNENFIFEDLFSSRCLTKTRSGCWTVNQNVSGGLNRNFFRILIFSLDGFILLLIVILFEVDRRRRRRMKDRQRFTLQMLTHELRTPITTVSLLLENFRLNYDQFSSEQQINFLKMSQEISRLKNSMQMSYAYLQTDSFSNHKMKIRFELIDLNDFLTDFIENQSRDQLKWTPVQSKIFIHVEKFWLTLCLENLIRNAFDHGKPPVEIKLIMEEKNVALTVQDQGSLWSEDIFKPFQKGLHSKGLGLGLAIIQQIMAEMHGQVKVQNKPTRFSLVFPRCR